MRVKLVSFGFDRGIPDSVSLVVDCRILRDPTGPMDGIRELRGTDPEVFVAVARMFAFDLMVDHIVRLAGVRVREGKQEVSIGVGCMRGHHRSVVTARVAAQELEMRGYQVTVEHRDMAKGRTDEALPPLSDAAQDRLEDRRCIDLCGAELVFEMDSDGYHAACCDYIYSHPLLRGDLITVGDGYGNVWSP